MENPKTILHLEEESAIIPLRRLNEMKENERVFREHEGFVRLEFKNWWDEKTHCYFISNELEASKTYFWKEKDIESGIESRIRKEFQETITDLEEDVKRLEKQLKSLNKKRWYQFIEFKPE